MLFRKSQLRPFKPNETLRPARAVPGVPDAIRHYTFLFDGPGATPLPYDKPPLFGPHQGATKPHENRFGKK